MRHFFEAWQPYLQTNTEFLLKSKSVATAIDLEQSDDAALAISQKRLPEATDFPMEAFNEISFTHHMEILHKTKELDERLFYIRECALGHWSKTALRTRLKENLYQHKGALTNNFSMAIPDDKQYMKAIQTLLKKCLRCWMKPDLRKAVRTNETVFNKTWFKHKSRSAHRQKAHSQQSFAGYQPVRGNRG